MIAAVILTTFLAVDILISNTSVAFVTRFPAHPIRTVLLTLTGAGTLAVCFASLYLLWPCGFDGVSARLTPTLAIYFSVVSMATVGFGDVHPKPDATGPQLVVVSEVFVGLYFVGVLVAVVASWANTRPGIADPLQAPTQPLHPPQK